MNKYQYRVQGVDYEVEIEDVEGNIAKVNVNGIPFEVEMQQPINAAKHPTIVKPKVATPAPAPAAAAPAAAAPKAAPKAAAKGTTLPSSLRKARSGTSAALMKSMLTILQLSICRSSFLSSMSLPNS